MMNEIKGNRARLNAIIFFVVALCLTNPFLGSAQNDTIQSKEKTKKKGRFRHHEDNAFDVSSFLLEHGGVLPVVIPITEPAIGYGGVLSLLYFHKRKKQYDTYVPPDVSGILGLWTENGTWGAGGFHSHTFGENRVRTLTAVIKPNINITYYGINSELLSRYPVKVNLDSWFIYQRALARISDSKFYLGGSYSFSKTNVALDTIPGRPLINAILKRLNKNSVVSNIKPMVVYDSRDNVFTPTKGYNAELSANYSAEWLGSDDDYATIHTNFYAYVPIIQKLYSGWRFNGSYLIGDAPFYVYPFVNLRGIPALKYQSDNVLVAETEWRYNFYNRWSVVGFSGAGKAFKNFDTFDDIDWSYNFGTGIRYELARTLGVHMGTDFAWGDGEDFAFYVVFGSSW